MFLTKKNEDASSKASCRKCLPVYDTGANWRYLNASFSVRNLINFLAILTIFLDSYSLFGIFPYFNLRGSYLILPIILILCFLLLRNLYFNKFFILILFLLVILSIYPIIIGDNSTLSMSKQVIGIFLNSFIFYLVLKVNNYDVTKLFLSYLNIAFFVGLLGLAQEIINILDIFPIRPVQLEGLPLYRVTSIFNEPAHFAEVMIPAFFVSLVSFTDNTSLLSKRKSLVIIMSLFLSFSGVGYIGVFLSLLLLIINYRKIRYVLGVGAILILFSFTAYQNINEIRERVDGTLNLMTGKSDLLESTYSTFALISNLQVGYHSFLSNPFFGSGIGSHKESYSKYIDKVYNVSIEDMESHNYLPLNVEDANSLFTRLLSETGLFGLFVFIIFLYNRHILKTNEKNNYFWIINNAILIFFLVKLVRGGHYFANGTFLFFWTYYFSKIQSHETSLHFTLNGSQKYRQVEKVLV